VALNLAGVTSKAYAERHGLSVHSLRHWVGRFKSDPSMAAAPDTGAFVALRLDHTASEATIASAPGGFTLRCAPGWELQMPGLPSPQWLAGLSSMLRQVR
jgi:hypothetical protein